MTNQPLLVCFKFIVGVSIIVTGAAIIGIFSMVKEAYESNLVMQNKLMALDQKFERHEESADKEIDRLWRKLSKTHPGAHND